MKCCEQSCVTERFDQKPPRALLKHFSTNTLVVSASNEYDRDLSSETLQFLLKFRPTHAGHRNVEDQTASLIDTTR